MSDASDSEKPEVDPTVCEAIYRDEDGKLRVRNARLALNGQE